MTRAKMRRLVEAREQGCEHGFGIGPACPGCVSERTGVPIARFPGWLYDRSKPTPKGVQETQ